MRACVELGEGFEVGWVREADCCVVGDGDECVRVGCEERVGDGVGVTCDDGCFGYGCVVAGFDEAYAVVGACYGEVFAVAGEAERPGAGPA